MSLFARIGRIVLIVLIAALVAILYDWYANVHPPHSSDAALEGNSTAGETVWVTANGLRLKARAYHSPQMSNHPVLVIVLHGDSPFHAPSYQYIFARIAAAEIPNIIAAAVLRPGYTDDVGDTSSGIRGHTTGDNYTPENVGAIASAATQLKAKYDASKVIMAGHSGGATISADILGRAPGVADGALLVSCPCDVYAFRKHMAQKQLNPMWLEPVKSLSPLDWVPEIPSTTLVRMLVGDKDSIAPPELTQEYATALRARHIDVVVTEVPGKDHEIFLEPVVFEQLGLLVKDVEDAVAP
ncbi:MAG TPA: prolyl oligopeptidase family serine peptidase [Candidatus Acidoferrum sp.]|nr:prolyl oligopeptidase family serine peptidase [Candidatus Acidoferrum sp.]